jgi:hypothetical protein
MACCLEKFLHSEILNCLINGITVHVGTSLYFTGNATNRELEHQDRGTPSDLCHIGSAVRDGFIRLGRDNRETAA